LIPTPVTVLIGNRQFSEIMDAVDPNFLQVIKLPLLAGNPASAFVEPNSVVLSQSRARKYFGDAPAVGKTIVISAQYCDQLGQNCQSRRNPLVVTGVLRDLPHNTQLQVNLLMPNTSTADPTNPFAKRSWLAFVGWGYVLLGAETDPNLVVAKLRTLIDHSIDPAILASLHRRGSEFVIPRLTPFRDAHLSTDRYGGMTPAGSWTTVYGFAVVGVLILLVACFNFTNLATARAMVRAREISLRKAMGAARRQLIVQFLGESVLTAMLAVVLALALGEIALPFFDRFLGAPVTFSYFQDWRLLLLIIALGFAVGLVGGVYPALVLSDFRPAAVLHSGNIRQLGSGILRTVLVVLQFAVSIGLGIAVLVVYAQISFARHMDLGFRKEGVVLINSLALSPRARRDFAQALRADPDILNTSVTDWDAIPFGHSQNNIDVYRPGNPSNDVFRIASIDPDFTRVFGIHLLAGRPLSEQHSQDIAVDERQSNAPYNVIINESAARHLGYTAANAVGRMFTAHKSRVTVVGVIADVKMEGASDAIVPTIYRYLPPAAQVVAVRVRQERLPGTLAFIDRSWRAFAPGTAMDRQFLNENFETHFLEDERQGTIFGMFVGIAIFIACLGLFGLAAFSTERRTMEIGIRKTFGARTRNIIVLLLWQFSIPVLIANLVAWPIAYYYLHHWLEGYAYRISLNPLYFVGAGLVALLIAWITVITHAARVAKANPIHALRYE
jgi:putative ABC transport system permease protein